MLTVLLLLLGYVTGHNSRLINKDIIAVPKGVEFAEDERERIQNKITYF